MVDSELENERRKRLRGVRRVVVKLGTSIVTAADGEVCARHVEPLVSSMAALKASGRQVVLVSSGAVGLGAGRLGLHRSRLGDVVVRQSCAAVGQSLLMQAYEQAFRPHGINIAQVLLTEDDFIDFKRYTNLRRTMERLLKLGVVPIVNENDTVSVAEIAYVADGPERIFGDNDRLAALVMSKLESDALILLTNVDGLLRHRSADEGHQEDFDRVPDVIALVEEVTPELMALASGPSSGGRGGMVTKLEAAQIALHAGGIAVIANGTKSDVLDLIFAGEEIGTTFMSSARMGGKRRWIAYAAGVRGRVVVNAGAREALLGGKASLLSSGVVRVEDQFEPQDVVSIADCEGRVFARGVINCTSGEASALIERNDASAARPVKEHGRVLVTRDNIVLLDKR
jgi:glutamate 5-kinase